MSDGALSRRGFLGLVVAGAVAAACSDDDQARPSATTGQPGPDPDDLVPPDLAGDPFTLGVASGDPLADSVILWTRLALDAMDSDGRGAMPDEPIPVSWEVADDEELAQVVRTGTAAALPQLAHSVHVDVDGLEPDRWYWYRFRIGDHVSPVGRTRTLPPAGSSPERFAFALASCQNYQSGYYTAYDHLVEEDLDLVFFVGDYIYESGVSDDGVRQHDGPEAQDLATYRNRHALYRSDPRLQAAHARFPWVLTWDDHEVENNYAGDTDQDGNDDPSFLERRAAAYQAYYEHLPLRVEPPDGPDLPIYRGFDWGDLASVLVVDTRQYRTPQPCPSDTDLPVQVDCAEADAEDATILGSEQREWVTDRLRGTDATWAVLANQIVFSPLPVGSAYNMDQWDGYRHDRRELLAAMEDTGATPIVLSGDIHMSGGASVHRTDEDTDSPVIGAELVCTSISSTFEESLAEAAETIAAGIPWIAYANTRQRGYLTVELTANHAEARYRLVETALEETSPIDTDATLRCSPEDPTLRLV